MYSKDWDKIYEEQKNLFYHNGTTFNSSVTYIYQSEIKDTLINIKENNFGLPESLYVSLRSLGIAQVQIRLDARLREKVVIFTPDSLWFKEEFSVLYIQFDPSDQRSIKNNHWKLPQSEHKHAFGLGDGWLIYSDSDKDPF